MPSTLTKETTTMERREISAQASSQLLLEGDMIVPDSKPDLQELLRCAGAVKIQETRITDDRISFSGILAVTVLYRAKNGEHPLYAMQSELPLADFLHMDGLEKDMEVTLDASLEHLDCKIINDRKLSVKAVLLVSATGEQQLQTEILSNVGGEGIECLHGTLRTEQNTATLKESFPIQEELTLPAVKPEISDILWETTDLTDRDMRAMEGKVMVRGNLRVCMLYCDAEGNLGSFCEKIPFSGYLEGENIEPKTELTGTLQITSAKLTPTVDEDGEARQLAVEVAVGATIQGREAVDLEILEDAYAPAETLTAQREAITYPVTVGSGKNQFIIKERIVLDEDEKPMLRAEEVWGEIRLSEAKTAVDAVEVEGVLTVYLLYHCEKDEAPLCMLECGIPFGQMMELRGVAVGDTVNVTLSIDDLDFQMFSEREGDLRAAVTMEALVTRMETAEAITDITVEDEDATSAAGAVIYVVQKGNTLWQIAKEHRTTVDDILAVNEIEAPDLIYPGQKLLIIKRIH